MLRSNDRWSIKEKRVAAIAEMARSSGKDVHDITLSDLKEHGLYGLYLKHYHSIYLMIKDAGLTSETEREFTDKKEARRRLRVTFKGSS